MLRRRKVEEGEKHSLKRRSDMRLQDLSVDNIRTPGMQRRLLPSTSCLVPVLISPVILERVALD